MKYDSVLAKWKKIYNTHNDIPSKNFFDRVIERNQRNWNQPGQ